MKMRIDFLDERHEKENLCIRINRFFGEEVIAPEKLHMVSRRLLRKLWRECRKTYESPYSYLANPYSTF